MSEEKAFTPAQVDDLHVITGVIIPASEEFDVPGAVDLPKHTPSRPVTRSDGVGAECDSLCARLLECHAADGKGLRYRFRDRKIAARCPGVPATRSNARRFQIIANYSMRSPLRPSG
jgi:hypothetical protein